VTAGGKESFLGDNYIIGYIDVILVMKPSTLTYPTVITYVQFPRELNSCARTKDDTLTDFGPKDTENKNPES
jgi:hypothetical protein